MRKSSRRLVQTDAATDAGAEQAASVSQGNRYADAKLAGLFPAATGTNGQVVGNGTNLSNPWRLGNVLALMLSTIVIGQYLVLSGGPVGNSVAGSD